jgi:hypothetical protein
MAEAMLIGAGIGAGGAMLSGQDPLKGAAIGGAMGGASAGFGGAGVASGASAGATNGASHLAQTGAQQATANAVASSALDPTLAGLQQEILSEVPQSVVDNSVMQPQDFIGSHLTNDVNKQGLMNNYSGFTDAVPDPLQAYPSFDKPIIPTADELAEANGGYGGVFDSFGDAMGAIGDFTGLDRGDVAQTGLTTGATMLASQKPPKPIEHAPMNYGITKPKATGQLPGGSLLSSFPSGGANQLTPEQIMKLKQRGII